MMLAFVLAVSDVAASRRNLRQGLRRLRVESAVEQAREVERC